ncbi:porin [Burkholderia sp. Ac-20353]|nr:porin [Burkholderia sp. Ac-20353]
MVLPIPAKAQSSVTLYGIISTGISYVSNQGGKSGVQMVSGPLQNNRWGLRVSEDLGDGTSAMATLENGFNSSTGALGQGGRMFGRQAWVGLSDKKYGTLTAGRQYDMMWDYLDYLEPQGMGPGFGVSVGSNDNIEGNFRYSNSLKYRSPDFGGFTFEGLYAFSNKAGAFTQNRAYSFGAGYVTPSYRIVAAYLDIDRPGLANSMGAVSDDYQGAGFALFHTSPLDSKVGVEHQRVAAVGGMYSVGKFVLSGIVSDVRYEYLDHTGLHLDNFDLIGRYRFTPALSLSLAYLYTTGRYSGLNVNPHWNQGQISLDYSLSKRTDIAIWANSIRSSGPLTYAPAVLFLATPSNSHSQFAALAGIRHLF